MKKAVVWLLVLLMCFTVCGCSKGKSEDPVTILGEWKYQGVLDCAYVFNADNSGYYRYSGVDMPFTYKDDGKAVSILYEGNTAENVFKYSISGKILSIEDSFGEMVKYERVGSAPSGSSVSSGNNTSDSGSDIASTSFDGEWWWEGQWYGWWSMYNAEGAFAPANKMAWDAYAEIEVDGADGHIRIWDSILRSFGTLVNCDVKFESGGDYGVMTSKSGRFFDSGADWVYPDITISVNPSDILEGELKVDPKNSSVSGFENMLEIKGTYIDPFDSANKFDYYIYLRPWGTYWDDVKNGDTSGCLYKDMMPVYYEQWYLTLLGKDTFLMPESFQAGIDIINGVSGSDNGGSSTDTPATLDPAGKAGADGIVDIEVLKSVLEWCKKETSYDTTYEEIAAKIGVHGKEIQSLFEDRHIYRWLADEDNYIDITFSFDESGQEYWNVTTWSGLK